MTQFTSGGPPFEGHQGGYNEGYGQQQGYENSYQNQTGYGGNGAPGGAAQSYYGSNEQAYQQYPNDRPAQHNGDYQHQDRQQTQSPYGQQGYAAPGYNQSYQAPALAQGHPSQEQGYGYPAYGAEQSAYGQPGGQMPGAEGGDADRGFMGAMAGGAAGGFGGHKMGGHGIIGGIGGAIAGSLLEDAAKKHHKEAKEKKEREEQAARLQHQQQQQAAQQYNQPAPRYDSRGSGGGSGGNFYDSSRDVRLEGNSTLVADCSDTSHRYRRSAIDLNYCFTNNDGRLLWERDGNFAASARSIRLTDGGRYLEAELCSIDGRWCHNRVNLNERIGNEDGRLEMIR